VSKASLVIVLAEDQRHQRFVRHYLYRLGYAQHDIRFEPLPNGRGCGEQWVRDRYTKAVAAYRARHARTALVVVIDADTRSVAERRSQLPDDRSEGEAIAILIPKRHIETWILCLNAENVDENTDYHARPVDDLIKVAAMTVWNWRRNRAIVPPLCVESLRIAFPEFSRIPQA
jgi:hypothetical protein